MNPEERIGHLNDQNQMNRKGSASLLVNMVGQIVRTNSDDIDTCAKRPRYVNVCGYELFRVIMYHSIFVSVTSLDGFRLRAIFTQDKGFSFSAQISCVSDEWTPKIKGQC